MADIVNKETRSRMMAGTQGKDTKPEITLRKNLHARGYRYRLHASEVYGRPDLTFPKFHAVILIHGCFWHRHVGCRYATTPSTRTDFWQAKFDANVQRDKKVKNYLLSSGWRVAIVWECALRNTAAVQNTIDTVAQWLHSDESFLELGQANI